MSPDEWRALAAEHKRQFAENAVAEQRQAERQSRLWAHEEQAASAVMADDTNPKNRKRWAGVDAYQRSAPGWWRDADLWGYYDDETDDEEVRPTERTAFNNIRRTLKRETRSQERTSEEVQRIEIDWVDVFREAYREFASERQVLEVL